MTVENGEKEYQYLRPGAKKTYAYDNGSYFINLMAHRVMLLTFTQRKLTLAEVDAARNW